MHEGGIKPGTTLGAYVVEEQIGRGGMGVVFRASHPKLHRNAAIKLLPLLAQGDDYARFEREAQAIAKMRHPNILTLYDFGEYEGLPYMVMELMANGSLNDHMGKEVVTVTKAVEFLRPLAEGIDYAHSRGIIHRDIKPANIFLGDDFSPVLADFGLARLHDSEQLTMTGTISGTPAYMAPEMVTDGEITAASDCYSFAVLTYELLTGRRPFAGSSAMDILYAQANTMPPLAREFNPLLSEGVEQILNKGLSKKPSERYSSCVAMIDALSRTSDVTGDATTMQIVPPAITQTEIEPKKNNNAKKIIGIVLIVLTLLGLSLAGLKFLSMRNHSVPKPVTTGSPTPINASPSAQPTVTPKATRRIEYSPVPPWRRGELITISGQGLTPGIPARIGIAQGSLVHPLSDTVAVDNDGSFNLSAPVPETLKVGTGVLVACEPTSTDIGTCISRPVTISG